MRIETEGWRAAAALVSLASALLCAGSVQASVIYELVRGPGFAVEHAAAPFSLATAIEGFLELPDEAAGPNDVTFFGQTGAVVAPGNLPVLDFRFAADGFEWTPATGDFGILGRVAGGAMDLLLLGLERDSCGSGFSPCWFDIFGDAAGFGLTIYRPSDAGADHAMGLVAEGLGLSVAPPPAAEPRLFFRLARADPLPVPEPSALLLVAGGLVAARLARRIGSATPPPRP